MCVFFHCSSWWVVWNDARLDLPKSTRSTRRFFFGSSIAGTDVNADVPRRRAGQCLSL